MDSGDDSKLVVLTAVADGTGCSQQLADSKNKGKWRGRFGASCRFLACVARQNWIQLHDREARPRWQSLDYSHKQSVVQAFRAPSLIHPRVYLGSSFNAANKPTLDALNIRAVLNCAVESRPYFPDSIAYCNLGLRDTSDQRVTDELCDQAVAFVCEQLKHTDGRCVLIHCVFGLSRSVRMATRVKMALEQRTDLQFWQTLSEIQAVRSDLNINVELLPTEYARLLHPKRAKQSKLSPIQTDLEEHHTPPCAPQQSPKHFSAACSPK